MSETRLRELNAIYLEEILVRRIRRRKNGAQGKLNEQRARAVLSGIPNKARQWERNNK